MSDWYDKSGNNADVVLSSRVRFARNLEGYPFAPRLSEEKAREIIDRVKKVYTPEKGYTYVDFAALAPIEKEAYAEKYLVSPEFADHDGPCALFENDGENTYVMVGEEDHLRIQAIVPGLDIDGAFKKAEKAEELADEALDIAFNERIGYLTHCPTNLGTGMRASVMMFLPALTMNSQMRALSQRLQQVGLTVRGINGEGSVADGAIYQISNQITLGISEEEILEKLSAIAEQIITSERELRRKMIENDGERIRDITRRSLGTALYAERIDSKELMNLYANIRLGVATGCITEVDFASLDKLRIEGQRALVTEGMDVDRNDATVRDRIRASLVRQALSKK